MNLFFIQVTVFHVVRNPGRAGDFIFTVDASLKHVTAYITGASPLTFDLTSPTGVVTSDYFSYFTMNIAVNLVLLPSPPGISQSSNQPSGPLASLSTAGNLCRLRLNTDSWTGPWKISVNSTDPYTVKITGQSLSKGRWLDFCVTQHRSTFRRRHTGNLEKSVFFSHLGRDAIFTHAAAPGGVKTR